MTVNNMLDRLEDLLNKAWKIPMTNGKCAIATEDVQDLIDEIRLALPKEIKQAKIIVDDRNNILADARQEAKNIISSAEKQAKYLVSENKITKQAQQKASRIFFQAKSNSNELKRKTNEYVENLLNSVERAISTTTQTFKNSHAEIKRVIKQSGRN